MAVKLKTKLAQQKLRADQAWEAARPTKRKKLQRQQSETDFLLAVNKDKGRKGGLYKRKAK